MNDPNGVWPVNPWQNQPGFGHSSVRSIHSVDDQPSTNVGVEATPAQAYAKAMGAGQSRALYHTIERRQTEGRGMAPELPFGSLQLGYPDSMSSERGLSFAQRLYASATSNKNSTLSSGNISGTPPIEHVSFSALPTGSSGLGKLNTTIEDLQSFNPSDLHRGHVPTQGILPRSSALPEASSARHSPLNISPVTRRSQSSIPQTSGPSSPNSIKSQARHRHSLPHFQSVMTEAQRSRSASHSTQVSGPQDVSAGTHQGFQSPVAAGQAIPSLSPLSQQLLNLPPSSPPFGGHGALSSLPEEFAANIAPIVTQLPAPVSHEDGLPDSFHSPSEVNHEEIPSYSLVDEQLPPPAFDDLRI